VGYRGIRIIEDTSLVDLIEDWSRVRSPSRARRRQRRGYRQNIRFINTPKPHAFMIAPNTFAMHPITANEFRRLSGS
jgi:hypothetical protein